MARLPGQRRERTGRSLAEGFAGHQAFPAFVEVHARHYETAPDDSHREPQADVNVSDNQHRGGRS